MLVYFFRCCWDHCFCTPKHKQPHANLRKGEKCNIFPSTEEGLTDRTSNGKGAADTHCRLGKGIKELRPASHVAPTVIRKNLFGIQKRWCLLFRRFNTDFIIWFALSQLLLAYSTKTPWVILLYLFKKVLAGNKSNTGGFRYTFHKISKQLLISISLPHFPNTNIIKYYLAESCHSYFL